MSGRYCRISSGPSLTYICDPNGIVVWAKDHPLAVNNKLFFWDNRNDHYWWTLEYYLPYKQILKELL